jgi:glutamate dehydrogenase (NADP+)
VFTGKGLAWGGSLIRPEATGYGCVYFAEEMLKTRKQSFAGKTVAVSGSGNVAQYAIEKVNELGGKVVTVSDSNGTVYDKDGISGPKWEYLMQLKNVKRGRITEYSNEFKCAYHEGRRPWFVKCDIALPCATENEVSKADAEMLVQNGCICVSEGANMPTTPEGVEVFQKRGVLYGPGKAANAGGVATSGLEMSQNSMRLSWTREEVDRRLHDIMKSIHQACWTTAQEYGQPGNYVLGANIAGFVKVANAMMDQGLV